MSEMKFYVVGGPHDPQTLPYPGRLPVVTWQLNVTTYPGAGTSRWTSAIREPSTPEAIALFRGEQDHWGVARPWLGGHCSEMIRAMEYLSGWGPGI